MLRGVLVRCRSIPGIPARISEGNEDILSTREMNIDSARKVQPAAEL